MRARPTLPTLLLAALATTACVPENEHEATGFQVWESPQTQPLALSPDGSRLYVVHTAAGKLRILNADTLLTFTEVEVGDEPVSVAVRPDGLEVWVANHLSDSVSILDTDPASPTYNQVVDTVQWLDPATLVTRFDEPAQVVFASNAKAYVTLSSRNQVAIVDVATRQVTGLLSVNGFPYVTAQEPRAMAIRNGRLYVAAFESGNRSELSACGLSGSAPQCTIFGTDLQQFATDPNLPGVTKHIVEDPDLPDRDLFVFDVASDTFLQSVSTVGTLLYGMAIDSQENVFVAQADARNLANGFDGENLIDLDNRMFLNQVTRVSCPGGSCGAPARFDLEPVPPAQPAPGTQLATPHGIAVTGDDSTLVVTAAGSHRIATVDAATGAVLGRLDVGAVPRGVVLRDGPSGEPDRAWVLNTLDSTLTLIDVSIPSAPAELALATIGPDPTPVAVRLGRLAFHDAGASSTGTFSCGSCHPDGNTDQLLWRIGGACFFGQCNGHDEPRSTMPVRGLRETLPLHWDGTLGDPVGGRNGAVTTNLPPSCDGSDPQTCFRDLANESLAGVMCDQAACGIGPSGLPGLLDDGERENLAAFLASVAYPPARARRPDDALSGSANNGFRDFFVDQNNGGNGASAGVDTCADSNAGCHALPLGAATNSSTLAGFDAPTMRGMTDRWLQFSNGITNAEELAVFAVNGINIPGIINVPPSQVPWNPTEGFREQVTFATAFGIFTPVYNVGPLDLFQMFEEASTGFSGAQSRQVTLNPDTAADATVVALMTALETADLRGLVNLKARGRRAGQPVQLSLRPSGLYEGGGVQLTPAALRSEALLGTTLVTLTAELRHQVGTSDFPQPLLATAVNGNGTTGDPPIPVIPTTGNANPAAFALAAVTVRADPIILVDGVPVSGTVGCTSGAFSPFCSSGGSATSGTISVDLDAKPPAGLHVLQLVNEGGPLSSEMPICVGGKSACQ